MRRILALLAAVAVLSGCAAHQEVPPPLTPAEVKAMVDKSNERWWYDMFPDEPQPVIDPIEYVDPEDGSGKSQQCIIDAKIEGVRETFNGGLSFTQSDENSEDAFNRVLYVCAMKYPYSLDEPEKLGYFSPEQLGYLYDYYTLRLAPCLKSLGYPSTPPPERYTFITDGFSWMPYWSLAGRTVPDDFWSYIDLKCPPPPFGPTHSGF